jgi:hypothetical protein
VPPGCFKVSSKFRLWRLPRHSVFAADGILHVQGALSLPLLDCVHVRELKDDDAVRRVRLKSPTCRASASADAAQPDMLTQKRPLVSFSQPRYDGYIEPSPSAAERVARGVKLHAPLANVRPDCPGGWLSKSHWRNHCRWNAWAARLIFASKPHSLAPIASRAERRCCLSTSASVTSFMTSGMTSGRGKGRDQIGRERGGGIPIFDCVAMASRSCI